MANLDEIATELLKLKKMLKAQEKKIDEIRKKQLEIEESLKAIQEMATTIETFPVKLNTTTFQITSQLEEKIKELENTIKNRVEESLSKMDKLVEINKRFDEFEENMNAYLSKIRYMLLELEDIIRRR